jgi:hypothetical protein
MGRPKGSTNKKSTPIPDNVDPATGEILEGEVSTPESQAVAIIKNNQDQAPAPVPENTSGREAALSIVGGVSTEQLKQALVVQTEQRKLIQQFIQDNLVEGIDYGKIHVIDSCPDEKRQRGSCKKDYHYSKSILFKPGQEKIFSLFGITDELEKDQDAYDVLQVPGMVAYKCVMYRGTNKVGEGRGAATLAESQNKPNSCIKKAEKRARMDAVLSLGFSAYFTQDLDDPDYKSQRDHMNEQARGEAEQRDKDEFGLLPRDPEEPIDNAERSILFKMILDAGVEQYYVIDALKLNGIEKPEKMTSGQARGLMGLLKEGVFKVPEDQEVPTEPETIKDSQLPEDLYGPDKPAPVQEAELVVDDDLKENTRQLYDTIGLNDGTGWMWFIKHVAGKPFGKWEKLTDEEWRRAFNFVTQILDGEVEVDDRYFDKDHKSGSQPSLGLDPSEPMKNQSTAVENVFPGAEIVDDNSPKEDQ